MVKKICFLTAARSEYGIARPLLKKLLENSNIELQVVVIGMHLSKGFGFSYKEILSDGFEINKKIETLMDTDSVSAITKSLGLATIGCAEAFDELKPDLLLLVGDRTELLAPASAALIANIPIAHIHGGELTSSVIDDSVRHAITKLATMHFVATEAAKKRVIQLGEHTDNVYFVGSLGVEQAEGFKPLSKSVLSARTQFKFQKQNLVVTYHPTAEEPLEIKTQMEALFSALNAFPDIGLIFTLPNSDEKNSVIRDCISSYLRLRNNAISFASLGTELYFSFIYHSVGVVGNSSSGLIEVPALKRGTLNIGNRQRGRERASSVIDCDNSCMNIISSLKILLSEDFSQALIDVKNPYANKATSESIIRAILNKDLCTKKTKTDFIDLK
ncbi:UDP-N-acetylglucosamine 2-epimerase [Alphaproteobacteria bacterium]|nr:UDP-N-acetylglucosamine 2-epimerase [Alphaproteobacteria bacterium]